VSWWLRNTNRNDREKPVARSIERDGHSSDGQPSNGESLSTPALESMLALALQGEVSRQELKSAIFAFTDEHRRHGEPVERILVPLKEAVAHARALSWPMLTSAGKAATADDVAATVVRCCIEHYYENSIEDRSNEDIRAR